MSSKRKSEYPSGDARTVRPGQPVEYHNAPEQRPTVITTTRVEGARPAWEVQDDKRNGFAHRVVCGDLVGDWCRYQQIATLKVRDVVYRACTDYFHGSLPTGVVFTLRELR